MFLDDINTSNENKKLSKLIKSLDEDFGVDVSIYENLSRDEMISFLSDLDSKKMKIMLESEFNTYHTNPDYTRVLLLSETLKIMLKEIHPKRSLKIKKVDEALDYNVHAVINSVIIPDEDNDELPDLNQTHQDGEQVDFCSSNNQSDGVTHENEKARVYVAVMNPNRFLGDKDVNIMSIEPVVNSQNEVSLLTRKVSRVMVDTDEQTNEDVDNMTTKATIIKGIGDLLESSLLNENELQRAEIVFATNDLVMRLGKMIEDLSKMGTDDIMPLVDGLRDNFGPPVAERFSSDIEVKIQEAANGIDAMKQVLDRYREKFEGRISDEDSQQPIDLSNLNNNGEGGDMGADVPTEEPAMDDGGLGDLEGGDEELDLGDEEGGDEPLGRALKESKVVSIAGKKIKLTLEQIEILHKAKQLTEKINVLNTSAIVDIPCTTVLNIKGKTIRITESQLKSLLFAKSFKKRVDEKKANNVKLSESQAKMLIEAKLLTQKVSELLK